MEGEDLDALKQKYGSELLEEAMGSAHETDYKAREDLLWVI